MVHAHPAPARPVHWSILILFAPLISLYLLYTDEGAYSFAPIFSWEAPFFMVLYSWGPLLGLFLMAHVFRHVSSPILKHVLTIALGLPLGAAIEAGFFYAIYLIIHLFI